MIRITFEIFHDQDDLLREVAQHSGISAVIRGALDKRLYPNGVPDDVLRSRANPPAPRVVMAFDRRKRWTKAAVEMRRKGASLQAIADAIGTSRRHVQQLLRESAKKYLGEE